MLEAWCLLVLQRSVHCGSEGKGCRCWCWIRSCKVANCAILRCVIFLPESPLVWFLFDKYLALENPAKEKSQDLGSSRFYEALEGPTLLLNMTAYGHVDMMDQAFVDIIQVINCPPFKALLISNFLTLTKKFWDLPPTRQSASARPTPAQIKTHFARCSHIIIPWHKNV